MSKDKKVVNIAANDNQDNIPHMLRALAQEVEDGFTPVQSVIVLGILDDDTVPLMFQYGITMGKLVEIGALQQALTAASETYPLEN